MLANLILCLLISLKDTVANGDVLKAPKIQLVEGRKNKSKK